MTCLRPSVVLSSILLGGAVPLLAQCNPFIAPADGLPGTNGIVHATTAWDPDGPGPLGEHIVVGGWFSAAGKVMARNLAMFDPQTGTWSPLGGGCNERVYALKVLPNGNLVVGGAFSQVGSTAAACIARWDGSAWHAFGTGMTSPSFVPIVYAMAVLPNGDLAATGRFSHAGGAQVNNIARWNGTAWLNYSTGFAQPSAAYALAVLPDGSLVAAGIIGSAGGTPVGRITRWNGAAWEPLGSLSSTVYCLHVTPSGTLVAGGEFIGSGLGRVAAWNGTSWSAFGFGLSGGVRALATGPGGVLLAGGGFANSGGAPVRSVAAWNGTVWTALGPGLPGIVQSLTVTSGNTVWAGGEFLAEGTNGGNWVARWNGIDWQSCGVGIDRPVDDVVVGNNGEILIAGRFTRIGSAAFAGGARWSGTGWSPLQIPGPRVVGMFRGASGTLYAATNDNVQSQLWREQAGVWTPVGTTVSGWFSSVNERPDGSLVVGGSFNQQGLARIARWDGTAWQPMGSGFDGFVSALASLPDGSLVAGGDFFTAGGVSTRSAARWNGSAWVALPGLVGSIEVLVVRPNGQLIAGGGLGVSGVYDSVRRWDGSSWQPFGSGLSGWLRALCLLPNGDLIAGGEFPLPGVVGNQRLARWNGAAWLPLPPIDDGIVNALDLLPDGTLLIGGEFGLAGGVATGPFLSMPTNCPATVSVYGAGCASSAGPLLLTSSRRPWLGTTFEASATGVPAAAIGVIVFGFQTVSLPLVNLLPGGVVGCSLLAAPDSLSLALPINGSVATALAIPSSSGLVGLTIAHQVVVFGLDPAGNLGPVTSTNGLMLQVGSL